MIHGEKCGGVISRANDGGKMAEKMGKMPRGEEHGPGQ